MRDFQEKMNDSGLLNFVTNCDRKKLRHRGKIVTLSSFVLAQLENDKNTMLVIPLSRQALFLAQ